MTGLMENLGYPPGIESNRVPGAPTTTEVVAVWPHLPPCPPSPPSPPPSCPPPPPPMRVNFLDHLLSEEAKMEVEELGNKFRETITKQMEDLRSDNALKIRYWNKVMARIDVMVVEKPRYVGVPQKWSKCFKSWIPKNECEFFCVGVFKLYLYTFNMLFSVVCVGGMHTVKAAVRRGGGSK